MFKTSLFSSFIFLILIGISSCSPGSTINDGPEKPNLPETPSDPKPGISETEDPDTVLLKICSHLDVEEECFSSRTAGNSRDLIGVEIIRQTTGSEWNAGVPTTIIYASGVFDNIEDIAFKFVTGGTYQISLTYFPNAKDIVYNYPDGTYGAPFYHIFGLKQYRLNEPVYFSGTETGGPDTGPTLGYLLEDVYQPSSDREIQYFRRGTTLRYSGRTDFFKVDKNTTINVELELCMMSITMQPENFTEGTLSLVFVNYGYMQTAPTWSITPDDEKVLKFQIPYSGTYNGQETSLQLFYKNPQGEKYLLATKQLKYKSRTNYVFKFSLAKREDGSIGLQMPSDESFENESATFDY